MKMMKRLTNKVKGIIMVAVLAVVGLTSSAYVDSYFEITKNLDIFYSLFKELNLYYVDETEPGDLMKKGIEGMLTSLDPYTNYIPESAIEDYRFMTTGQYGGVGALIRKKGDRIVIAEPYKGSPTLKAGLLAGDVILEIDGKSTEGKSTSDVSKVLKGQPGTPVKLLVKRHGQEKTIEKEVEREEIQIESVPFKGMLDEQIGYINLSSFTRNCSGDVKEAFTGLKKEGMTKLIFDLRGNPGGLLNEAVKICNLFVDKGELIVSTKGKVSEWSKNYIAQVDPIDGEIPIVVLVNRGSASASEIVSGTLQDLDRGVVLGEKTFGKGLVQTTRPLSYNSQLKVTTAKYYIPSGRCIQALDYSNRNEDGSVGHIADSLKSEFKTKAGRIVFDGGGVDPDVESETQILGDVSIALMQKMLVFDFATEYFFSKDSVKDPSTFQVTDELYTEFKTFLADKELDYTTNSEILMEELKRTAEEEKAYEAIEAEYTALETKVLHNKTEDLETYKPEIKEMLRSEIVSRYHFQEGRIAAMLQDDPAVIQAKGLLNDLPTYEAIFTVSED
ncbi:MAG: carboxyl-terminal processing protease [Granulosicoccus sp.]|jgi:carboxyl-terminal processing protease